MARVASILAVLALILVGCGSSTGDRAASGAGIGAGAGAVVGAVTGLSILEGALIGAAAGGLTGALTDEETINLGKPVWEDGSSSSGGSPLVMRVQRGLTQLGYDPGPVDGAMGPRTASAIRQYQSDYGLLVDGKATPQLAEHMEEQI